MESTGYAATAIAAATTLALYLGHIFSRRGQKEQNVQQAAATVVEALVKRSDRAENGEIRERERAERERARADRAEDALDELRDDCRRRLNEQAAKCRAEVNDLHEALVILHRTVRNEVAKSAAETAIAETTKHPHNEGDVAAWLDDVLPKEN